MDITTKLLSEVLDINDTVHVQKEGNNKYFISRTNNPAYIISIYEFAFKCKEWAFKYRYMIDSNISPTLKEVNNGIVGTSLIYNLNNMESKRFQSDTELGAIFKACEWILKEKNK